MHDKVFTPSTFIAHEPQTPWAQDLLKVSEESISFFELALKFAPNDFNANGDLGTIYLKSNNPQKGILFLLKAVEIKPDDFIMNLNVGHTYFALHQYANCLKFLEKGIQLINNRIKKFP